MKSGIRRVAALLCVLLLAACPLSVTATPVGGGQASPSDTIKAYGCDMSFWNVGGDYPDYSRVDFEKMKADGCEFVILRVGFEGTASRQDTIDSAFLNLYGQAKQAGLDVGVYFYALATTYEGAAQDAAWCIDLFEQHNLSFEYPIYYDVEDPGNGSDRPGHNVLTADEMTELCLGWAQTLEAAGYFPGVYSTYDTLIKLQPRFTDYYDVWYAYVAYEEGTPEFIPEEQDHSDFCGLWQYSWVGSFDGAVGDLDVNVAYKDYPSIMKTNGYNGLTPTWNESLSVMPRYDGFHCYDYNGNGEGIAATYQEDGAVLLTNTVSDTAWSWPSAYMVCRSAVDIHRYPLLTIQKSGTAHFNAVLQYSTADGVSGTLNIAALDGQELGEFNGGDMTVTVDIHAALRRLGHLPPDGKLSVIGITYYIMGGQGTYISLQSAAFTESPTPDRLTSPHFSIDDRLVADVKTSTTIAELLLGLDNAHGTVVRDKQHAPVTDGDKVASGMTVTIEKNGEIIRSYTLSVIGDVNGDGLMNTQDARTMMLGTLSPDFPLNDWQTRSADMDKNETINTADVRSLMVSVLRTSAS